MQEVGQVGEEGDGEEIQGFRAGGEDVVDDVIVQSPDLAGVWLRCWWEFAAQFFDSGDGVGDDGVMRWQIKVLRCVFVDQRIDLDGGHVDAVVDQGRGEGANAQATEMRKRD